MAACAMTNEVKYLTLLLALASKTAYCTLIC